MNKGWPVLRLAEACEIRPPKSEARARLSIGEEVSFLPMEDLQTEGKFVQPKQARALSAVQGSYTYFADGDVLLAKITPCFENGKLGIASDLVNGIGFGSSEYFVFRPNKALTTDWLYYYLSRESFRDEGAARMSGAVGHKRVSKEFIEAYLIPIPPVSEQRRIVSILDGAFERIATAKANAEKNLQNSRALFESHLQAIFNQRGDGWKTVKLGETADYFIGLTYAPKDVSDRGIIVLRSSNIQNDRLDFSDIVRVNRSIKKDLFVRGGDILMCSRNGSKRLVGKTAIIRNLEEDMTFGTFMTIIRSAHNPYLYWFFKSKKFREQIGGGQNPSINQITKYMLDDISVPLPPLIEQEKLVRHIDSLNAETRRLESIYQSKLAALEGLKKSLLHRAFAGNL